MKSREVFTCPYCKINATTVRYNSYHGEKCKKKPKIVTPTYVFDINKYRELHEKFMELIGRYHNEYIFFTNHPSKYTSRGMVPVFMQIRKHTKEMKENHLAIRKLMDQANKNKKELKQRKTNGNDTSN